MTVCLHLLSLLYMKKHVPCTTCEANVLQPAPENFQHHKQPNVTFFLLAEASCAGIVRSARSFVRDVGKDAASRSGGLVELASRSEQNAERDTHRLLVGRYKLALPIPISQLHTGDGTHIPVLRLRDWARYLLDSNSTHILCGLDKPDWNREAAILQAFWKNYETQCPDHPVFEQARLKALNLSRCFPMILHGDEGRGRRRTSFLVMNFHCALGQGLRMKSKKGRKPPYVQMLPNYHGHTLTSRFLMCGLPKHMYTDQREHVFEHLLELAAEESQFMFYSGLEDRLGGRGKFTMAVLFVAGDWPWLADSGYMLRSFRNVQKHKSRKSAPVGICHQCRAGQLGVDFEQLNSARPKWLSTMFSERMSDADWASPLEKIPHPAGKAATLWAWDVFHTWHLGVSRCLLGSFIALLANLQPAGAIDSRFEILTGLYIAWCKAHKRRSHVTKLTKELIGWPTVNTFPSGTWHKGSLSTTLMAWVQHLYETEGHSWGPMLQLAGKAAVSGNAFLKVLYNCESWLSVEDARLASRHGLAFLQHYADLALMALNDGVTLWIVQPKFHSFHHLVVDLLQGAEKGKVLNPLTFACQADEDFIGRPSRLSRRVTAQANCAERVIERYLQSSYGHWVKAGFIVESKSGK